MENPSYFFITIKKSHDFTGSVTVTFWAIYKKIATKGKKSTSHSISAMRFTDVVYHIQRAIKRGVENLQL